MVSGGNRHRGGRIQPDQRNTNDSAPIIGLGIEGSEQHKASLSETKSYAFQLKTVRNYRNRLGHIMNFWKTNYPEYYTAGVKVLSEEELQDQDKYYWKNKTEIIYTGINPQMVK